MAGIAEAHDPTSFVPYRGEISRFPCVGRAARAALERGGYRIADIDVAEVYGAFAGMEPMMYEELGFFAPGEAPAAIREGRTTHGGDVLLNPSGGRLSLGHPAYATPLLEFTEVVRQLQGRGGREAEAGGRGGARPHRAGLHQRLHRRRPRPGEGIGKHVVMATTGR